MSLVACGLTGLGDTIWETESGRPLGISVTILLTRRESRRLEVDEWCLDELDLEELDLEDEWCLDDEEDLLDFSLGTSRMFKTRPVVGSVVESCEGSCETW